MLPNWIYYLIGKKSGGGSPGPATRFVVPNRTMKFSSAICTTTDLNNCFDNLDFSEIIYWNNFFNAINLALSIDDKTIDLSSIKLKNKINTMENCFSGSSSVVTIRLWNEFDSSLCENFRNCFSGDSKLIDINGIEKLDFSRVGEYSIQNIVNNCTSLSNSTIQNLLKALNTFKTHSTLRYIGLSSTQATTATTFTTEWNALVAKGWTTGY